MANDVKRSGNIYQAGGKRIFDMLLVLIALPILLPLGVLVAMLVRLKIGASVLFTQDRLGRGGLAFRIRKFRTMTDARDSAGQLLPDDERLTGFGKILRATSLDELPEIINILTGEMSLVGPRPL